MSRQYTLDVSGSDLVLAILHHLQLAWQRSQDRGVRGKQTSKATDDLTVYHQAFTYGLSLLICKMRKIIIPIHRVIVKIR